MESKSDIGFSSWLNAAAGMNRGQHIQTMMVWLWSNTVTWFHLRCFYGLLRFYCHSDWYNWLCTLWCFWTIRSQMERLVFIFFSCLHEFPIIAFIRWNKNKMKKIIADLPITHVFNIRKYSSMELWSVLLE